MADGADAERIVSPRERAAAIRIFLERFVLAVLAPLFLFVVLTNPLGWSVTSRVICGIGDLIVAAAAAYFAGWEEWRWRRVRSAWWGWLAIGGCAGALVVAYLNPFDTAADAQKATLIEWLKASQGETARAIAERDDARAAAARGAAAPQAAQRPTEENPLIGADVEVGIIRNMAPSDRTRLADVFYEISQSLDQAEKIRLRADTLRYKMRQESDNGSIATDIQNIIDELNLLTAAGKTYKRSFEVMIETTRYYDRQVQYITSNSPYHPANETYGIENGASSAVSFLTKWIQIQNKSDAQVLQLMVYPQNLFQNGLDDFARWQVGCVKRLSKLKEALL